jgi:uncharacterized membrane protein YphA (DoxX/SURF4 family)
MVIGPTRTRTLEASRRGSWIRAAAAHLARCMGMIMPARASGGFPLRISRAFGARLAAPAGQCEILSKTDTPRWIGAILSWPWLLSIARIALTSAFLIGGVQKLVDFPGAVAEQANFGLQPAWVWAAAAILVELAGSALVIIGRWVWLGAGGLGVLTAVAMLTANSFWTMTGHDRLMALNAFLEHLGLIAGLVLVSVMTVRTPRPHSSTAQLHSIEASHDW